MKVKLSAKKKASPGSDKAIKQGCRCPVLDNEYGAGCGMKGEDGNPLFWIDSGCPLHGKEKE